MADPSTDFANALSAMARAGADMKSLNREFEETTGFAKDLAGILGQIAKTSESLPRGIQSSKDLMGAMLKDEKLFAKIQKQSVAMQQKELKEYWQKKMITARKISGLGWDQIKQTKQFKYLQSLMLALEEKRTKNLKNQFQIMKDQGKEKQKSFIGKAKGKAEEFLGFALPSAPVAIGVAILVESFKALYEQINMILKVSAQTTRVFGSMGDVTRQTTSQASSMGFRFEKLGLSFDVGAQAVLDFVKATKQASVSDNDLVQTGVKLTQVYGLSADEAGRLSIAFNSAGISNKDFAGTMVEATAVAKGMNIPVNDLIQMMGKSVNILQRFGIRNRQEFLKAGAVAEVYGVSLDKINSSFGEQMDTFDKTSDVAAKLNSVFGTHINSYKLMLETDPTKRMMMLTDELFKQGKSWDKLSVFEKNVVKQQTGLDNETAALVLSEENRRKGIAATTKEYEKHLKKQKNMKDAQNNWNEAIGKLQETLINFKAHFRNIFAELGRNIIAFFGGLFGSKKSPDQLVKGAFDTIKGGLESVEKFLKGSQGTAKGWGETLRSWIKTAADFIENRLVPAFEKIDKLLDKLDKFASGSLGRMLSGDVSGGWSNLVDFGLGGGDKSVAGKAITGGYSAKDALITKSGQVVQFNPQDNILATKSPISRTAQGATATAGKSTGGGDITIMPAPIYLDGTKIAEAIFRATRR